MSESFAAAPENWPEAVLSMVRATLSLVSQAIPAIEALPDTPAAARCLHVALMENRASLADLEPTVNVLAIGYQMGCEDTARALASRTRLRAV
jgi:hypothetical protein